MRAWKALDAVERVRLLGDPWAFKDFIEAVPQTAAYTQRQALLHLVFPSTFEDMVSREHKALIVTAFASLFPTPLPADPDRALSLIRSELTPTYGSGFSFYDSPIEDVWRPRSKSATVAAESAGEPMAEPSRRAWLIRGTVDGTSLVPGWLEGGYCAMGWNELGEFPRDISRADLIERLQIADRKSVV